MDNFRVLLEELWVEARRQILNAAVVSADTDTFILANPDQMGDPQHRIDRWLHQRAQSLLGAIMPGVPLLGEEHPPTNLLLDKKTFNYIAYLDALDGSRQAFSLPGGWSINIVLQRYLGLTDKNLPRCSLTLLGTIDAEGVSVLWVPAAGGVDLRLVGAGAERSSVFSDQLVVAEGFSSGITGVTTVMAGGYKSTRWDNFVEIRESVAECPVFNTAGAPVARKTLQNSDVVVAQLDSSTLWDGIAAGLIAAAGGYVTRLDAHGNDGEALPAQLVQDWFSEFGYERRIDTGDRLKEHYCIPPFMAGMDGNRVEYVTQAFLDRRRRR
jgi:fructose-1,6-bisphosphatase/inositol monophosphatase family enzyme